jgi:hypothetical protein
LSAAPPSGDATAAATAGTEETCTAAGADCEFDASTSACAKPSNCPDETATYMAAAAGGEMTNADGTTNMGHAALGAFFTCSMKCSMPACATQIDGLATNNNAGLIAMGSQVEDDPETADVDEAAEQQTLNDASCAANAECAAVTSCMINGPPADTPSPAPDSSGAERVAPAVMLAFAALMMA